VLSGIANESPLFINRVTPSEIYAAAKVGSPSVKSPAISEQDNSRSAWGREKRSRPGRTQEYGLHPWRRNRRGQVEVTVAVEIPGDRAAGCVPVVKETPSAKPLSIAPHTSTAVPSVDIAFFVNEFDGHSQVDLAIFVEVPARAPTAGPPGGDQRP